MILPCSLLLQNHIPDYRLKEEVLSKAFGIVLCGKQGLLIHLVYLVTRNVHGNPGESALWFYTRLGHFFPFDFPN